MWYGVLQPTKNNTHNNMLQHLLKKKVYNFVDSFIVRLFEKFTNFRSVLVAVAQQKVK